MRKQTARVLDGKVETTDLMFAQIKIPRSAASETFLSEKSGYTDERLRKLFGKQLLLGDKA